MNLVALIHASIRCLSKCHQLLVTKGLEDEGVTEVSLA